VFGVVKLFWPRSYSLSKKNGQPCHWRCPCRRCSRYPRRCC